MRLRCDVRLSVFPNMSLNHTTLNITNYSPPNTALPSHKTLINNTAVRTSKLARSYQYYCDNCRGIFHLFQNRCATYNVQCKIWDSQSSTAWDTHPLGCKDHVDGSIVNWFVIKITVTSSSRSSSPRKVPVPEDEATMILQNINNLPDNGAYQPNRLWPLIDVQAVTTVSLSILFCHTVGR